MKQRRAVTVFVTGTVAIVLLFGAMPSVVQGDFLRFWGERLGLVERAEVSDDSSESLSDGDTPGSSDNANTGDLALDALNQLEIKGRTPKTGYERSQFGDGWAKVSGCSTRDIILYRDLQNVVLSEDCKVMSGVLDDPYTGEKIVFNRERSSEVQIDHVIALSDAWQKGAQNLTQQDRVRLANDPLELLAVSGPANQQKSDGDAATWLPKNKGFRCEYVARQIAIKIKYYLWVTQAEYDAMKRVLGGCEGYRLPAI